MDIRLATNNINPILVFHNVEKYQDQSGFGTTVRVRSDGFSAEVFCTFENWSLAEFITQLQSMNETLTGQAMLKPQWDNWFIVFTMRSNGHVIVSGLLYSGNQELKFEFTSDKTCLGKLIDDLTVWSDQ